MRRRARRGLREAILALGVGAAIAAPGVAEAGANRCSYNGQVYAEGLVICQAGLLNLCMNGEWQSKGSFCNGTPDGAVVGGGGGAAPVIIEAPAAAVEED